ncbi:hypothetical protein [Bythopirellula goksoeyrii]|uniref:Uncharacterized protein n=1 Tax=Bythopirellula goksoeyrii TaxID=1400387 RepID=A0A5B9Q9L1_9BACT|nr:hypothetical protein [Bythopirellula goksoeyrii]QEG34419.1 hypothetical protein Pr1d_16980 [Bythopirellula goksoeyrii]
MAFLEIRVSNVVSVVLIALGLPAAAAFLSIGVPHLIGGSWADFAPALVLCGLGMFLLQMAIAAFRGFLHRKKS